jgi:hypothetical protein
MTIPAEAQKTFSYYLKRLESVLIKIEHEIVKDGGNKQITEQDLLHKRLIDDMLPFGAQVNVCVSFVIRFFENAYELSLHETRYDFPSLTALRDYINSVNQEIEKLAVNHLKTAKQDITMSAGEKNNVVSHEDYFFRFVIPNFFFHFSVVYSLARAAGIELSKGDFDGLHYYKPGFSFE